MLQEQKYVNLCFHSHGLWYSKTLESKRLLQGSFQAVFKPSICWRSWAFPFLECQHFFFQIHQDKSCLSTLLNQPRNFGKLRMLRMQKHGGSSLRQDGLWYSRPLCPSLCCPPLQHRIFGFISRTTRCYSKALLSSQRAGQGLGSHKHILPQECTIPSCQRLSHGSSCTAVPE